jgi:hypothetical protein
MVTVKPLMAERASRDLLLMWSEKKFNLIKMSSYLKYLRQ